MFMETPKQYSLPFFSSVITASTLLSFALCLAAELKKSRKNDLRLDGKLCYLPGTAAFELGIAGLICLTIAQVIGSLFICTTFGSRGHGNGCPVRKPTVSCSLLVFSWISFVVAAVLISGATSMSRSQDFGEGWLDGECYLVKDGVYVGSAILALLALGSTLGSGIIATRQKKDEQNRRVHAKDDR